MLTFSEWLKDELNNRGWSQSELARRSQLSQATISRVLRGVSNPGPGTCSGVAAAFNIPLLDLLEKAGINTPKISQSTRARFDQYLAHLTQPDLEALLHIIKKMKHG